jgi:phage portal protein BeeE
MDFLEKAMRSSRGVTERARENSLNAKMAGGLSTALSPSIGGFGALTSWQNQAKYKERYALFTGWLYAAVNAIALEASGQPVKVARVTGEEKSSDHKMRMTKERMTETARSKAADSGLEILKSHKLLRIMEKPNDIQGRAQFVYSFIANLCLTGWAFIVRDSDENGNGAYYSLPTTWIKIDHERGPFSRFRVVDPTKPQTGAEDDDWLTRDQVAFAHLPNPADPRQALAPAGSQMPAIRINDHINTSRERFFENGIFPSVVVTVGKNPHPDVPGGVRPFLTGPQRNQIDSAIRKTMAGIYNYGNPAVLDGMIESIDKLSMTDNEMGWEKSEESVKTSILSAFCVHPYILGAEVGQGGYAQVVNIEKRFFKRVNCYLDMLGTVMTNLVASDDSDPDLIVWWEQCKAEDPTQVNAMLRFARGNSDISQNEFRSILGFGPDEDRNESLIPDKMLTGIVTMLGQVGTGAIQNTQAAAILEGLGLPSELAVEIAGPEVVIATPQTPGVPGQPPKVGPPKEEESEIADASDKLDKAVKALRETGHYESGKRIAEMIVDDMVSKRQKSNGS